MYIIMKQVPRAYDLSKYSLCISPADYEEGPADRSSPSQTFPVHSSSIFSVCELRWPPVEPDSKVCDVHYINVASCTFFELVDLLAITFRGGGAWVSL